MFDRLIHAALHNRSIVLLLLFALVGSGTYSLLNLPIDAVPDITNVQVMALTSAPALGPEEIEQFVTIPVENAMNGIPHVQEVRSFSQFGLSGVTIVFADGTDIYWARQQVGERLTQVRTEIPEEFGRPEMGPIATGLGEIIQIEVRNRPGATQPRSLMELRTILDWDVARPLKSVPGVVEVNAFGGELKTYEVTLDPGRMKARGIAVNQVLKAIESNNANAGGGYLERNGELRVIRGVGLVHDLDSLERIVLSTANDGTPVSIRDVAEVRFAPMIRNGAVTRDGQGEAVTATILMLAAENSRVVVNRIKGKLDTIRAGLPEGVDIDMYYDRANLIEKTIKTVSKNLFEGAILVVAVLMLLLGNIKAGLIVALTIPLSMLFAGNLMLGFGIAGSLMSLGALDFGLIVDSSVILIENCVARLAHARPGRSAREIIEEAAVEVRKPIVFGVAIITLVHLPILALEGVEGKMFRPMALTVIFALLGSLLLTFTATPVLASLFLRPGLTEKETLPVRIAKRLYEPTLRWVIAHPWWVVLLALVAVIGTVPVAGQLGGEFIPKLDEGDIVIVMARPPSGGLEEAISDTTRMEQALRKEFPNEIRSVVSRTGRPEIGIDPAGVNMTDVFVFLRPKEDWKRTHDKMELIGQIEKLLMTELPGTFLTFTQPIESRFNDLLSGVRADVGLSLFGDDLEQLQRTADELAATLQAIPGASDVKAQVLQGLPFLNVKVDRARISRYGINVEDVLDVIRTLGGLPIGRVVEGQRRFDVQVRFASRARNDLESIRQLQVMDPRGRMIPLEDLAEISLEEGVYEIWRKDRQRRAMVQANVRGRDLASFVQEAQASVARNVKIPTGYQLEWGGTFENMQAATERLTIVVPVALAMIFLMLYGTFQSVRLGLLIFLSVPLGAIGGILALWLAGLNMSVSAGVGFIALSGVAVLDGLVLVSAIRQLIEEGHEVKDSVYRASMSRLRPILMTGLVAGLGFIPMAIAHGAGAEVQRPLATVVIGGLFTSTFLKLVVLPAIYRWFDPGQPRPAYEALHVEPREDEEEHDRAASKPEPDQGV